MNSWWQVRAPFLTAVVSVLAACASPDGDGPVASAAESRSNPASDAERLAVALADASAAFSRGDEARLANALRRIDAIGGRPLEGGASELSQWRQVASEVPPMRGRSLGAGYRSGDLSPGRSEQLEQVFLSGKRASVALSAPGSARLTLEVQDRRDEAVCDKEGNPAHCQWVPVFTDRYRIRIANTGATAVRYYLVVE